MEGLGKIFWTDDGGSSWSVQTYGSGAQQLHAISYTDSEYGFVVGGSSGGDNSFGTLLRTTTGGE